MVNTQTATETSTQFGTLRLRSGDAPSPAPATTVSDEKADGATTRTGVVDGWWRGNKAGTIPAYRLGYPEFYDKTDEASLLKKRQWIKVSRPCVLGPQNRRGYTGRKMELEADEQEHLALCFRMWADLGFGHGASGHITVKVSLHLSSAIKVVFG